ncbi:hypothetical protein ACW9UR_23120 [Halovulum sp. GXIMD14794]
MAKKRMPGFFGLDRARFEAIRSAGFGVAEIAAYLSLLKSTDSGNEISTGGVNSICNWSGLRPAEAKLAINNLSALGVLEVIPTDSARARRVPRHRLSNGDTRRRLAGKERLVFDLVKGGSQPKSVSEINAAHRAMKKGWMTKVGKLWEVNEYYAQPIFIPNNFVDADSAVSTLHRLVDMGVVEAIYYAVDLYGWQNLWEHRGIPRDKVEGHFMVVDRFPLGAQDIRVLRANLCSAEGISGHFATTCDKGYWDSAAGHVRHPMIAILEDVGLLEWAIYSVSSVPESRAVQQRLKRPLGVLRRGQFVLDTPESRPAFMAYLISQMRAARISRSEGRLRVGLRRLVEQWRDSSAVIAVEERSASGISAVAVLRLANRAITANALAWHAELVKESENYFLFLKGVAEREFVEVTEFVKKIEESENIDVAISMELNVTST